MTPTQTPTEPQRAAGQGRDGTECTRCPSWVLRCGHLEGQLVYLADVRRWTGFYEVHGPTTMLVESEDIEVRRHSGCVPLATAVRGLADEEFDRRNLALLGREAL